MGTPPEVYQQSICTDCLQLLVNGESDHSEQELKQFHETLSKWAADGYTPAGMDCNDEGSFSWSKCDICDQIAGMRYKYDFIQTKKVIL